MSKKGTIEVFQSKITRNDRFAQMSHQEKVIEQKKKEIQARLEQKQKAIPPAISDSKTSSTNVKCSKSPTKLQDKKSCFNTFSNDGSFLDQFKQMKDKKLEQKLKSFKSKDNHDKYSDDRNKNSRWSQRRGSQSPKDVRPSKPRTSRFSDKAFEPKINITATYSNLLSQTNFDQICPQNMTGQPLLKNVILPPRVTYPSGTSVIAAPPVLLNMPPPQIIQNPITATIVVSSVPSVLTTATNVGVISTSTVLTTVSVSQPPITPLPPQSLLQETSTIIELASIPPPNPIQVHNIPQPEPINTLTIPSPAPIQVQNIPPPSPMQLNEIPNPKPLDLLNIPTPNDTTCVEKNISDCDFIKNVPPPNKSVPPPTLPETAINMNLGVPPPPNVDVPPIPTCLPPPNVIPPTTMPPPPPQTIPLPPQNVAHNLTVQGIPPQSILVHAPPPQTVPLSQLTIQSLPPPPPQNINISTISLALSIQNPMPVGVPPPPVTVTSAIPSLMAQPILPPPGMGLAPPINVNCPPPLLQTPVNMQPPPSFINQPPPLANQMPPMNVPPPASLPMKNANGTYRDINSGTVDYEAMASLGRMVAQCGPGIEDVVRQRKIQDPSLWFLYQKESAAYRQYQQLVDQFVAEMMDDKRDENCYKPEDIYDPDHVTDDESDNRRVLKQSDDGCKDEKGKRKRKSRWGEKDTSVPPPTVVMNASSLTLPNQINSVTVTPQTSPLMLTRVTRNDPALIQYAITTFGSANLSEEDWKKAEDHYKINLLYQDMLKKRLELERLRDSGKNKYEYDSDEETDGGTWEHKLREKEMVATQLWANELTKQAEGKHHIGDFLPPEELKRFLEKSTAVKEGRQPSISDYKEFKLKEDNIGFKMLQKLGWSEGQGLGSNGSGIVEPVNKGTVRDQNQGLGLEQPDQIDNEDDEYESYRKRMMLAYRFRPNPLNNPRRPYY